MLLPIQGLFPVGLVTSSAYAATLVLTTPGGNLSHRRHPVRTIIAALLVLIGSALTGLTLMSHWLSSSVLDTAKFTETYADLPLTPEFQETVASALATKVEESFADNIVVEAGSSLLGGLAGLLDSLPLPSTWGESVGDTPAQILEAVNSATYSAVVNVLSSGQFQPIWQASLHEVHSQLVGILAGTQAPTMVDGEPHLSVELQPLGQAVRETLMDQGAWYANLIPQLSGTVPIIEVHDLPALQQAYRLLDSAGPYLPWAAGSVLVGAIALASARFLMFGFAGLGVAAASAVLVFVTPGIAGKYFTAVGSQDTHALTIMLWDRITAPLISSATTVLIIGAAVMVVGFAGAIIASTVRRRKSREVDVEVAIA